MNRDRKQLASLSSGAPPQAWEMREGFVMIGRCKDCKKWDRVECLVLAGNWIDCLIEYEHQTPPDFGCVYWESNETASA